jgi:hypothetical protein
MSKPIDNPERMTATGDSVSGAADLCDKCHASPVMHEEWRGGQKRSMCCGCHVEEGNPPADWHAGCMKAKRTAGNETSPSAGATD